ncbi:MAG: hypothetical protein ABSE20_10785 [Acetobacteraceae bacterium]|jgi:hypothetical protein
MLGWTLSFRRRCCALAVVSLLLAAIPQPVCAASLTPQDLQILGSALAFVQPRPVSDGVVAIVYAGKDSSSRLDAEAIRAAIGESLTANGILLTPKLVEAGELASVDFSLVIVAAGANSDAVPPAARTHHALCVTADQEAVRLGFCTMAIHSTGKVEILLNYRAALASGVSLATAFRMMVSEL